MDVPLAVRMLGRSLRRDRWKQDWGRMVPVDRGPVSDELWSALSAFDRRFVRTMRDGPPAYREHGRDYTAFYRSIGSSRCLAVRSPTGDVVGTICLSRITMHVPGRMARHAVCASSLRVVPEERAGAALPLLLGRAVWWTIPRASALFGVIIDGSTAGPERFTKRLGIPGARTLGVVRSITFPTAAAEAAWSTDAAEAPEDRVRSAYARLMRGFIRTGCGDPSLRSQRTPKWLMVADGSACACLEDYLATKRYIVADGGAAIDMSHLSCLGFRDVRSCARIVRAALAMAQAAGTPMVQLKIDASLADDLVRRIGIAPEYDCMARVCGYTLGSVGDAPWSVHSTEI